MAHYAFLDDNNIVTEVIVGIDETQLIEGLDTETWYGNFRGQTCKRTSFNANIRRCFAGVGYYYSGDLDLFYPPKCHNEAILNLENCSWECVNSDHEVPIISIRD